MCVRYLAEVKVRIVYSPALSVEFRASNRRKRCSLTRSRWPEPVKRPWNLPNSTQIHDTLNEIFWANSNLYLNVWNIE
jgi:hypothetical protein